VRVGALSDLSAPFPPLPDVEQPTAAVSTTESSYAADLRQRADALGQLAVSIERSLVMNLVDSEHVGWPLSRPGAVDRGRLCETMLRRNLHQLHRAADDLRVTAKRFRDRADELDAAVRDAA